MAEDDVRVGDGRRRPAAAVAGRARNGAGALRADPERPGRLGDVGDRAAAGADAGDVDGRGAHGEVADLRLARDLRPARHADGDVGRRAAHVEGEDAVEPRVGGDEGRAADAAGRAREHGLHRRSCTPTRGSSARRRTGRPGAAPAPAAAASPSRTFVRYLSSTGATYAFISVVTVRSYSRNSGRISDEIDTGRSGATEAAISAITRSWRPFAWALSRHTVSASTPSATSSSTASRTAASSIGSTIAPSAPIRSGTSRT